LGDDKIILLIIFVFVSQTVGRPNCLTADDDEAVPLHSDETYIMPDHAYGLGQ
jgi:hypothetical protein